MLEEGRCRTLRVNHCYKTPPAIVVGVAQSDVVRAVCTLNSVPLKPVGTHRKDRRCQRGCVIHLLLPWPGPAVRPSMQTVGLKIDWARFAGNSLSWTFPLKITFWIPARVIFTPGCRIRLLVNNQ